MIYDYGITNTITVLSTLVHFSFILLVIFCLIDIGTACVNTALNLTCPGGYIIVHSAIWQTVNDNVCMKTSPGIGTLVVTNHMKNKCDNKTSCDFTVNDSSFNVACGGKCSGLSYIYECVSKLLVLRIVLIIINNFTRKQYIR